MLAGLEREFATEGVLVIGVHSPKFPREGDVEAVRDAVKRYGVTHPVVVDTEHRVWESYGVHAWPTIVVVDPEGYIHAAGAGEPESSTLSKVVRELLDRFEGRLNRDALPLRREPGVEGLLSYPSKISVEGDLLAIADSGHHRILICRLINDKSGSSHLRIERAVGGPEHGMSDGPPEAARFTHPYGLAFAESQVYVADTGNHAIRVIELDTGYTTTVAGTGDKGAWPLRGGEARSSALRSPWDLAWDEARGTLFVAMASSHQIWKYAPETQRIDLLSGSGREARVDGHSSQAAFAQPSGLTFLGNHLYVADSEISCIREVDISSGYVTTVCGGDLFDFGDADGVGDDVRLQHVMDVAASSDGILFIADSYNHKVKRVDPRSRECTTVFGGFGELLEPEGVAVLQDGSLLVADTNNHRVVRIVRGNLEIVLE